LFAIRELRPDGEQPRCLRGGWHLRPFRRPRPRALGPFRCKARYSSSGIRLLERTQLNSRQRRCSSILRAISRRRAPRYVMNVAIRACRRAAAKHALRANRRLAPQLATAQRPMKKKKALSHTPKPPPVQPRFGKKNPADPGFAIMRGCVPAFLAEAMPGSGTHRFRWISVSAPERRQPPLGGILLPPPRPPRRRRSGFWLLVVGSPGCA